MHSEPGSDHDEQVLQDVGVAGLGSFGVGRDVLGEVVKNKAEKEGSMTMSSVH